MIRDKGPLHGLGYGLTSRDIPVNENEHEGLSPNSGSITKALDGNPVAKFFAATAGTLAVSAVLNSNLKKGGLKLAKKIQDTADGTGRYSGAATSLISGMTDIRKHFDELQGVKRSIEGVDDPYSRLVFETSDGPSTGYLGSRSERYGILTKGELQQAGRGIDREPAAVWTMKDEIQKRLVRATRRMPYELPSLYITQRSLIDPLLGKNESEDKKRLNWYNPADVISDFVKQSLINVATLVVPFELGGAGVARSKSSLHTFRNSMTTLRDMSPGQQKLMKGSVNLLDSLQEVGNTFTGITSALLKKSSQVSRRI